MFICINENTKRRFNTGKYSNSVAAGMVFFVSLFFNLNINKKEVHSVSEISGVTINKCYKKLEKYQEILIPSILLNRYQL